MIAQLVEQEATMLATVDTFPVMTLIVLVSAGLIWLTPRSSGLMDISSAH